MHPCGAVLIETEIETLGGSPSTQRQANADEISFRDMGDFVAR